MEAALKSQVLKKTNIPCLYRSADSGIFYGIFTRKGDQVKKHYAKKLPDSTPK